MLFVDNTALLCDIFQIATLNIGKQMQGRLPRMQRKVGALCTPRSALSSSSKLKTKRLACVNAPTLLVSRNILLSRGYSEIYGWEC